MDIHPVIVSATQVQTLEVKRKMASSSKVGSHLPTQPDIWDAPDFRNFAGDVRRRAARPWAAETPPVAKPKPQRKKAGKSGKSGNKQGIGFDNGEGSDSNDDKRGGRRGVGYYDFESLLKLKTLPKSRNTLLGEESIRSRFLDGNESGRLVRSLLALDEKWERAQMLRKVDARQNATRELLLKRLKRSRDSISSESYDACLRQMHTQIREQHEAMQTLASEALADGENREDNLIQARGYDYLQQIIFLVEDGVISRLKDYIATVSAGTFSPESLGRQKCLVQIVAGVAGALWAKKRCKSTDPRPVFFNEGGPLYKTDYLVESYIQYVAMTVRRGKRDTEDLISMIRTSQTNDGSLTAEYVAWCTSFLDHDEVNAIISKYHRFYGLHFLDVTDFGDFLEKIDYEPRNRDWPLVCTFIDDDREDKVRLGHFRGHCPVGLCVLSEEELSRMGWHRGVDGRHWRYRHSSFPTPHIFKVKMNGEVVGLWMPDGDIDCDEEFEASLEKQREGFPG